MNTDKIKVLESFINELNNETNDLCVFCHDYYEDDALSSYETDMIEDPDTDDFGGDNYRYLTKSGAKGACKRAVKKVVSYVKREYEKTMKAAVSEMAEYLSDEMPDYLENVRDFIEVFSDELKDCTVDENEIEDEALKQVIQSRSDRYFSEFLDTDKVIKEMTSELERRINWALSAFKPVIPDNVLNEEELFGLCYYDYDEDDRRYCYELDEACDLASERIDELIETKAENLFNGAAAACLDLIESYADKVKNALLEFYIDIVGETTGKEFSEEEICAFREKHLSEPVYTECAEAAGSENKTWVIYPWDLLE